MRPNLSTRQIELMKHCIGFSGDRVKRRKYEAFRNYFTTSNDHSDWDGIVRAGLAEKAPFRNGVGDFPQVYRLNEAGIKFMSELLEVNIVESK